MDTKANLANRKKINELAIQHNKLTTLVGCLLNELNGIKKELRDIKTGNGSVQSNDSTSQSSKQQSNKFSTNSSLHDLRAEDILRQLSINTIDN